MTIDEAINHAEEIVKGYERIKCIKAITLEELKYAEEYRQVAEWLKEFKQLREQTRWIPVSEKLPEIHQDVLLELRGGEILTGFKAATEPYFYVKGLFVCYVEPVDLIAWQPLPEPYKAESEVWE